jgi:hypothetical protein
MGSWVPIVGALVPPVIMALVIVHYGVNVPFRDQWDLVPLLRAVASEDAGLGHFWVPQVAWFGGRGNRTARIPVRVR